MASRPLEVADIVRAHAQDYVASRGGSIPGSHARVLRQIAACRTADLGGHVDRCDSCGHTEISYNSCRNRHCPKCQAAARSQWYEARAADVLPVPYFHVVFTVPKEIAAIAMENKRVVYDILFRAATDALLELGRDPKHLGARIGVIAVLHTWGQNLQHHPHVHCLVPGGGLSDDGRWIPTRPRFLFPVKVLGKLFRGKFLARLRAAHAERRLSLPGLPAAQEEPGSLSDQLGLLYKKDWVVYAKPPFGGPEQVLKYLARYTHRVAIANSRLVSLHAGSVTFRWKDYAAGQRKKVMTLDATEFIRRFLLHVLPTGFVRIRHYGFLANRLRRRSIESIRRFLGVEQGDQESLPVTVGGDDGVPCPACRRGRMVPIEVFGPHAAPNRAPPGITLVA
jgi:hypothetical protein